MRPFAIPFFTFLAAMLLLSSCNDDKKGSGRPVLTVSVEPQRFLLEAIAGDLYDVAVIIPENADAETYEPPIKAMKDLSRSSIFFAVGAGGFETSLIKKLKSNFPQLPIVDSSEGLNLIRGTHPGDTPDPHVWGSVSTAKGMADNMTEALCKADPRNATVFRHNNEKLRASLDSLDVSLKEAAAQGAGTFVIWHPSLSYLARDYGLRQLSLEVEGKEVTPGQFRQRLDEIKKSNARIMFVEATHGPGRAKDVAAQAGLKIVTINPGAYDWPRQIKIISRAIAEK